MSITAAPSQTLAPAAPRTDTLGEAVLLLVALSVIQRGVGFVRGVLFCRWLSPEELGQWDMSFGFFLLAAPLAVLGLPGSFGRYSEYYRQQGQLAAFLRHTAILTAALAALAVAGVALASPWFARLVFGRSDQVRLMLLLAAGLGAVIAYNFLVELLTSLRLFRLVSRLQLAHSLLFALAGAALICGWQAGAASVVLSYTAASLACSAVALVWLRGTWRSLPAVSAPLGPRSLLVRLMPFAVSVWVVNWLSNSFELADRYMILHCGQMEAAEALRQVGNYHSSRLVPLLLVSIAALLSTVALPHLSHDWEAGRRQEVSARVNLMLKLATLVLLAGGAVILLAAPLLFDVAFQGKYSGGLAVLPWTLAYCVWFGTLGLVQNYLWCAEKPAWASFALLAGLGVNVGLNLLLLPHWGLLGAVVATAAANFATLALTYGLSCVAGLKFDPACCLLAAATLALCLPPAGLLMVLAALALWAWRGRFLFSPAEKEVLGAALEHRLRRLRTA